MKNIYFGFLVIVCFSACNKKEEVNDEQQVSVNENIVSLTEDQYKNAGIETGKIEKRNISSVLKLRGMANVPPENIVTISFPMGGYLKQSKLVPGMQVNKGEAIAVMEDPQFIQLQQDYLIEKINMQYQELEYNRQKELNKSKASSDKLFQQTEMGYLSKKINVKALEEKLELIGINPDKLNENTISRTVNIYAPINGYVAEVMVNVGKYVEPSDVLFELVNPEDMHLTLNVFEKDVNLIEPGQKVIAYTNINPEKKYEAEVKLVGKEISEDRSVAINCEFKSHDKDIIPNMFMNAEIEIREENAFALPVDAIVSFENKQYVFVVLDHNQFEITEVTTGVTENGFTEIILENQKDISMQSFVVKGTYSLLMKMKNAAEEE